MKKIIFVNVIVALISSLGTPALADDGTWIQSILPIPSGTGAKVLIGRALLSLMESVKLPP